ncbi:MAG: hypothetical protein KC933_05220 [Myxococcales bacterium]|nr:hypothetical protein [Myxococcales bacterium]
MDTGYPDTGIVPDTGVEVDAGYPDTGYPDTGDYDAGYPDSGIEPDAGPPPPVTVNVSGKVVKLGAYLAGNNDYSGGASILAYGVYPSVTTVSDAANVGYYSVTLPSNGQAILVATKQNYNQTFNSVTTQDADIANKNIYITEQAWLAAIATTHNVNLGAPFACQTQALAGEQCLYTAVVGKILDDGAAGAGVRRPVAGVAKTDFAITGGVNDAPWYVKGPYFLNYDGTPNVDNLASVTYQNGAGDYLGGLYVFFSEVPLNGPVTQPLKVAITYNYNGTNRYFGPANIQTFRAAGGGVTWYSIYETGVAPPPPVNGIDFDSQIYPLLLPVDQGGLGCQGCHTNQGGAVPAGGMNLYGGPATAYDSLDPNRYPARVTVPPGDVSASYLLKRPLYEANGVQDHPIFAFLSEQDPGYQLIYTWISEGAIRNAPLPPVSFYNEVRPLLYQPATNGGAGCYACHGDAANAGGGFYVGGDGNDLYNALVNTAPTTAGRYNEAYRINKNGYPERSLVLTKPLFGDPEPHAVKIFYDAADPRYQVIYRWIQEGYTNDTP